MMEQAKLIDKLEKGRAEFAYKCVEEVIHLVPKNEGQGRAFIEEFIADFKSKVKKNMKKRSKMEKSLKIKSKKF